MLEVETLESRLTPSGWSIPSPGVLHYDGNSGGDLHGGSWVGDGHGGYDVYDGVAPGTLAFHADGIREVDADITAFSYGGLLGKMTGPVTDAETWNVHFGYAESAQLYAFPGVAAGGNFTVNSFSDPSWGASIFVGSIAAGGSASINITADEAGAQNNVIVFYGTLDGTYNVHVDFRSAPGASAQAINVVTGGSGTCTCQIQGSTTGSPRDYLALVTVDLGSTVTYHNDLWYGDGAIVVLYGPGQTHHW